MFGICAKALLSKLRVPHRQRKEGTCAGPFDFLLEHALTGGETNEEVFAVYGVRLVFDGRSVSLYLFQGRERQSEQLHRKGRNVKTKTQEDFLGIFVTE